MGMPARAEQVPCSYADYLSWTDDARREIIDGAVYDMTPAPLTIHQAILGNLFALVHAYLKGKPCKVFIAPFDVRLLDHPEQSDHEIHTVVQPDLVVICNPERIDTRGCKGSPTLVVEILSPSTAKKDQSIKLARYERAGVPEYWIVQPADSTVSIYRLGEDGRYGRHSIYSTGDRVQVELLGDLEIDLTEVFAP